MPNAPISLLPSLSAVTNSDLLPIVSSGTTYNLTFDTLSNGDNFLTRNRLIYQSGYTITFSGNSKIVFNESVEQGDSTEAIASFSHAQGSYSISVGYASHAEGNDTSAYGDYSHSEGASTHTGGEASHAEGANTETVGYGSHAEGNQTIAYGDYSHTEGIGTLAFGNGQTVVGKYNTSGNTSSLLVVGNGVDTSNRSDLALFESSGITINGDLTVNGNTNIIPFTSYQAMITQTAATNPTVTVLQNNLGVTLTWTRTGNGIFDISFSSPINLSKLTFLGNFQYLVGPGSTFGLVLRKNASSNSNLVVSTSQLGGGAPIDSVLYENFVEIRIYS